jgi:hypothetical protein
MRQHWVLREVDPVGPVREELLRQARDVVAEQHGRQLHAERIGQPAALAQQL